MSCVSQASFLKEGLLASAVGKRLTKAVTWNFIASVSSRSFALLSSIVIARILGKALFGELGIIQSTLDTFGAVAGFGMGLTSAKYVAEFRSSDPEKAGRIIALASGMAWVCGLLTALVLALCAPWLATHAIAAPTLAPLLKISALSLLLSAVNGAQMGVLMGFEAFRRIAQVCLVSGFLTMALRIYGTVILGVQGAVYGMIIGQVVVCGCTYSVLRRVAAEANIGISYAHCLHELRVLWKFSIPVVLSALTDMPAMWVCNAVLVNQPNGYAELGVYIAANQWYTFLLFIPGILSQTAMPIMADRISRGEHEESRRIFTTLLKANTLVVVPMIIVGCFSKVIMGCYGREFSGSWPTMLITVITAGVVAMQMPAAYMFAAKGKMWIWLLMSIAWGFSFIGLNFLFVRWGSAGMAMARLIAYSANCILALAYIFYGFMASREPPVAASIVPLEETTGNET